MEASEYGAVRTWVTTRDQLVPAMRPPTQRPRQGFSEGKCAGVNPAKRYDMFVRFRAANPSPKTELEYTTPFERLIAGRLSAQATDVGVNKSTRKCRGARPEESRSDVCVDHGRLQLGAYAFLGKNLPTSGVMRNSAHSALKTAGNEEKRAPYPMLRNACGPGAKIGRYVRFK